MSWELLPPCHTCCRPEPPVGQREKRGLTREYLIFIKNQAFSPSYDLAPSLSHLSRSPLSRLLARRATNRKTEKEKHLDDRRDVPGFVAVVWFVSFTLPSLPSSSCFFFLVFLCVAGRANRRERGEEGPGGIGKEPIHTTARAAWSSIIH